MTPRKLTVEELNAIVQAYNDAPSQSAAIMAVYRMGEKDGAVSGMSDAIDILNRRAEMHGTAAAGQRLIRENECVRCISCLRAAEVKP